MNANVLILADKIIRPFAKPELTFGTTLPNIEPLKYMVSLEEEYFYELKNIYRE